MRLFLNKKFATFSIILILISVSFFTFTQKAKAQLVVEDPGNQVVNTISSVSSASSEVYNFAINNKEFVLDPLANGFAKQIVQQITSSIVNWINSGFQGSPSFIQNPGGFFLDVADQATGEFISKSGVLSSLCSPFSIDLRLALAFKYHPNVRQRYACTLSTIIGNSKNAVQNASINGFTAGDFKQGGWPAFVSLTTEPQNNIYGAYLTAESDLSFRVASLQGQQKDEISAGKGFLSWRDPKCIKNAKESQAAKDALNDGSESSAADDIEVTSPSDCPIQTPGSVISGALETQLGSPVRQLELADEFGEIVNALFAQLVTKVLQGGLSGVSQRDSSGSTYLSQVTQDVGGYSAQVQTVRTQLLSNIDVYITRTTDFKKNRDNALQALLNAKAAYENAQKCYIAKLSSVTSSSIQPKINEIDNIIATSIVPRLATLYLAAQDADQRMATLLDIKDKATNAKTINDLNAPSAKYNNLVQNNGLTSAKDLVDSQGDLSQATSYAANLIADANRKLQACQILPGPSNTP